MRSAFCLALLLAAPAFALKYAAPEHQLSVDPAIPGWKPPKSPACRRKS